MRERLTNFLTGLAEAWSLAKPYFTSEERWVARGLLAAIVTLNLMLVGLNVVLTYWNRDFFAAIQVYDEKTVVHLLYYLYIIPPGSTRPMPGFAELVVVYILIAVYAFYLNQMLQIKWRQWLTTHYVENWLTDRAYYTISLSHNPGAVIDNPDQRISEDLRDFTANSLALGMDFISNVVTLFSFVFVLYAISGSITVLGVTIHGYMLWVAVLYSAIGTAITQLIGRKLVPLSFSQQRLEANFRYGLVRVRENPEAIALSRGEGDEQITLRERFQAVRDNFWAIMRRTKLLNFFTIGFTQIANIFPLVVILPRYFAKLIGLGELSQIPMVFGQVQGALSWFITSYPNLVAWRATVSRLHGFREAMVAARAAAVGGPRLGQPGTALVLDNLTLTLPDGRKLLDHASLTLPPGEKITVTGPSGSGKSTLFRAIAGIWPFGGGQITPPSGSLMFLPQKPYFPLGSLKRSIAYPAQDSTISDDMALDALSALGLGHLASRLHEAGNWGLQLSGGEQQRLALARALVATPDWLFLDEATSALDQELAAKVQATLTKRLPHTTIVAISHHDGAGQRQLHLADGVLTPAAEPVA
ncbi:ABC transporter ATP-binding protein/permease [Acidocella aromatica]|uniref:Putative ATP-binding cassette transporter n=1 Tax=Acidocella aromatica TaxID=1303579 RepID=A0A840V7Y7_9PROT|nr:ABC transporter ATP-binding protein/permease [Acidocella aromatica]MBB5371866.1 putative ATP-binding cassette transporter [Acidocella aromatica]